MVDPVVDGGVEGLVLVSDTGWLSDITGTPRTGMWVTGATLAGAATICLAMKQLTDR
jgi:hypothetical protein